ncbi:hypothetical protein LV779_33610 [Streptomyces thinghirensis]|nr:hypothetical protein [Streptomyces thinghirensis]
MRENRPITDLGTLKALAHPLRMQLYRGLCVARTATCLAARRSGRRGRLPGQLPPAQTRRARTGRGGRAAERGRSGALVAARLGRREHPRRELPRRPRAGGRPPRGHPALPRTAGRHVPPLPGRAPHPGSRVELRRPRQRVPAAADPRRTGRTGRGTARPGQEVRREGRAADAAGDTEGRENVALHVYGFPFRV